MFNKNKILTGIIPKILAAIMLFAGAGFAQTVWGIGSDGKTDATSNVIATLSADGKTLTISGTGTMKDFTSSSAPWSSVRTSITALIIENSVTSIGNNAFYGCFGLTGTLTIPNSVTSIGDSAFYICSGLTGNLTIPSSVTSIGNYAFYGCSKLTSVTISESATSIGDYAFYDCIGLTGNLIIPESVTSIGNYAFYYCEKITSVTISENVTTIGNYAFRNCSGLTGNLTIPSSVTSIGNYAFYGCSKLTSVTISESATSIGDYAFYNCIGLTGNLTIPSSVTSIGNYAFYYCEKITSVTISKNVTTIGNYAFRNCSGLTTVNFNATNCTMGKGSSPVFYSCSNLATLNIGENVTNIPNYAFINCRSLTGILTIPNSVTSIGDSAFYYCEKITSVTISENVTTIGVKAFQYCSGLTGITIPENVTTIGGNAFYYCSGLTTVNFNATNCTTTGSSSSPVFQGCSNLATLNIGANVTNIPDYAFNDCGGLTGTLTIPNSVTSIGRSAFAGCGFSGTLTIPNSVTSIGRNALFDCSITEAIFEGAKPTTIDLYGTNALTKIYYLCANAASWSGYAYTGKAVLPIELTVSFNTDGGSEVAAQTTNACSVTKPADPTKAAHEFVGWYQDEELTIPWDFDSDVVGDMTLYAKWELMEFGISYNLNGGANNAGNPSKYIYSETETVPLLDPTRTGYTFGGWFEQSDFSGTAITQIAAGTKEAKTLYAKWKKIITISGAKHTKVYDGTTNITASEVEANLDGVESGDNVTVTVTAAQYSNANAGTKEITITGATLGGDDVDNYILPSPLSVTLTMTGENDGITKKPITVTADNKEKTYGSNDPAFTYTVSSALISGDTFSGGLIRAAGENAGTYAITQNDLSAGDNYEITFVSANLEIMKRLLTITANTNQSKIYGASDPIFEYATSENLLAGNNFTGKLERMAGETVGTYAIEQGNLSAGNNYDIAFVSADFSITKRPLTITGLSAKDKVYDGTETAEILGTAGLDDVQNGEIIQITTGTAKFSDKNVGENKTVTFSGFGISSSTADVNNYELSQPASVTANITKKALTITADDGQNKTYGESDPAFTYTVNPALISGDDFSGELTRAAGENVGEYAINIGSLSAGNNYDMAFESKNFKITKRALDGSMIDGISDLTYNGEEQTPTLTVSDGAITISASDYEISYENNKNAGIKTAKAKLTATAGGNYSGTAEKTFTINKKTPVAADLDFDLTSKNYNGTQQGIFTPTLNSAFTGMGTIEVKYDTYTLVPTDVGTYEITVDIDAGTNFTAISGLVLGSYGISTIPLTITADDKTVIYGSPAPEFTVSYSGFASGEDENSLSETLSFSTPYSANDDVGDYAIIPSGYTSNNYEIEFVNGTLTVSKRDLSNVVIADITGIIYNGEEKKPVPTVSDAGVVITTDDYIVSYSGNKNAGTATATITATDDGNYSGTKTKTFTIAKKAITVTAEAKTKTYGESDPELTYTVSPTLLGGNGLYGDDDFTGGLIRATGENAGIYAINKGTLSAGDNYDMAFESASFDITKRPITVTPNAEQSKKYDDDDPTFEYETSEDLLAGNNFTGKLSREEGEIVGTYEILQGTLDAGNNYDITLTTGVDFAITERLIEKPTLIKDSFVYDATVKTVELSATSSLYSLSGQTATNAGNYIATVALNDPFNDHWTDNTNTDITLSWEITKKPLTISSAEHAKVYDGLTTLTPADVEATLDGVEMTDETNVTVTVTAAAYTNADAGTKTLNITDAELSGTKADNYELTLPADNLTVAGITKRPLTVTASANQSKTYGEDDPDLTYTTSENLLAGNNFSGELSRATGETVGTYEIRQNDLNAGDNYKITFEEADFEITKKALSASMIANIADEIYNGSAIEPALSVSDGAIIITENDYTVSYSSNINAGEATATITATAGGNYKETASKTFTINKKAPVAADLDFDLSSNIYNGTPLAILTPELKPAFTGMGAITVYYNGSTIVPTNLGTYQITVNIAEGDNFTAISELVLGDYKITKKAITVTAEAKTKTYGEDDPEFTYTVSPDLESGDDFIGELTREDGENIGTYEIELGSLSAGDNYDIAFVSADFTITKRPITITANTEQSKIYGESDPTFEYATSENLLAGNNFTGKLERTAGENTGTYAIEQGNLSAGNNYDIAFVSADFTITKRPITVAANANQSKIYGESDPTFEYTTSENLLAGNNFTGKLERISGENVGTYTINQGNLSAGNNYDITFNGADFEITKRPLTITATAAQSKVFGENDPELTYSLSEEIAVSGKLTREAGENAGIYKILQGSVSADENYSLNFVSADFTIEKAQHPKPQEEELDEQNVSVAPDGNFSIAVTPHILGMEYSIDGENWQDSPKFTGLKSNTEYDIWLRLKESENHLPSEPVSFYTKTYRSLATPIEENNSADKLHGIRFAKNIVSDKAEIFVNAEFGMQNAELKIYDVLGNVVFESSNRDGKFVWNLRNAAGRIVANGSYIVIAEVKDNKGMSYGYSAKLGVKR